MDELAQLTALCARLGASPAQSEAMALQLIKRADQLSVERGQSREETMTYLLRLVVQGRSGEVPPELNAALSPALLPGASSGDSTRGLHGPATAGLAGRRPNFTRETPQQAAGNDSAFQSPPASGPG